ncbi:protein of unknown function [Pseudomonas mediterranea]
MSLSKRVDQALLIQSQVVGLKLTQTRKALNASPRLSSNHYQKDEGEPACSLRLKDMKSTALAACPT